MPNKRKMSKLATKMLISGKLNSNKDVQSTVKYLQKKAEIDNEGINFDFEDDRNDFGKLEEHDDDTRTLKRAPKKRKQAPSENIAENDTAKIPKQDIPPIEGIVKKNSSVMPKKSQKNKYFFVAHPEALKKKKEIFANQDSSKISKFIIDKEKIKLNEVKMLKNLKKKKKNVNGDEKKSEKNGKTSGKKQIKKGNNKIWSIQECSESSSAESDSDQVKAKPRKEPGSSNALHAFELNDIDKNFSIKKTLEKQTDGSFIEVIKPEFQQAEDSGDDAENASENASQSSNESEEESDGEGEDVKTAPKKKEKGKPANPMMEKLKASRFRYLNELLYTHSSSYSFDFFQK